MTSQRLDRFLAGESRLHRLDARLKVLLTLYFIITLALLPDGAWLAFGLAWGLIVAATAVAHLPYRLILSRSLIVLPFMLAAVTVLFSLPGTPIYSGTFARWPFVISDTGLIRFLTIVIRGWLSIQAAILLTATTPFPALMQALTRLRVPALLVTIISFMYRYLFVLVDEAQRLRRARRARSARRVGGGKQGGSLRWRATVTGHMIGQLFVRSLDRSDRVYNGMLARGYQGRPLPLPAQMISRSDWLLAAAAAAAITILPMLARL